jgi:Lar family restriction alleviation protein
MNDAIPMKPCPFCGSDRVGIHHKRAARKAGYQAICLNCKVGQTQVMHGSMERAAEVWNTRVAMTNN